MIILLKVSSFRIGGKNSELKIQNPELCDKFLVEKILFLKRTKKNNKPHKTYLQHMMTPQKLQNNLIKRKD